MRELSANNKISHLQSIQVLRGLAALLVVIGHSLGRTREILESIHISNVFSISLPTGFGVDLFFVISGFIIWLSTEKIRALEGARKYFMIRRWIRIIPIYWICTSMLLLFYFAKQISGVHDTSPDLLYVLCSYLFIPYKLIDDLRPAAFPLYDLGWTLNYELYFYTIFSLFLFKNKITSVICIFAFMLGMVLAGQFISHESVIFSFWSQPIIFEFLFGIILGIAYSQGVRIPGYLSLLLLAIAIFLVFAQPLGSPPMVSGTHLNGFGRVLLWGLPAFLAVLAASLGPSIYASGWIAKKFVYLGDASYSVYLFHPFGLMACAFVFKKFVNINPDFVLYILISLVVVSVTAGLLFYRFVEKPLTVYLTARFAPSKKNPSD